MIATCYLLGVSTRRLEGAGPFTFVATDAVEQKVREGGRAVGVHALVATGVNETEAAEDITLQALSARTTTTKDQPSYTTSQDLTR